MSPPPLNPEPAFTAVMSAALLLVIVIVLPEWLIPIPEPAANVKTSLLPIPILPPVGVVKLQLS